MAFKVGDRVRVVSGYQYSEGKWGSGLANQVGVVESILIGGGLPYGVRFSNWNNGHALQAEDKSHNGWYFYDHEICPVSEQSAPASFCPRDLYPKTEEKSDMASFETGATRNHDIHKFDYEGFLSPLAMRRFGEYMHKNRHQKDGTLRASDNWQLGIPLDNYIKSMMRHVFDAWLIHRGYETINPDTGQPVDMEEALCAIRFNADGYLHEILKKSAAK